ncbi:MAG: hypothetical protein R3C02_05680 [Planctomycetaceae bacterium]
MNDCRKANSRSRGDHNSLQREEVEYRFHAYLQGEVEVQVDGETVLIGSSDEPGLDKGGSDRVEFRSTGV